MIALHTLALALVGSVAASPLVNLASLPTLVSRQDAGTCRNQSCEIAAVAGSTGATTYDYPSYPVGDTQDGDCCIIKYFPAVKTRFYQARPSLQAYCAAHGGDAPLDSNPPGISSISKRQPEPPTKIEERAAAATTSAPCKPKILIFVKGTLEPGDVGITLGPQIQQGLDPKVWDVHGVNYDNSFANDYCLGLPGGIPARQLLEKLVAQCPKSVFAMSGYSQGAMVIRNALARADKSAVAKVKVRLRLCMSPASPLT